MSWALNSSMQKVLIALIPGAMMMTLYYGVGVLVQLLVLNAAALIYERSQSSNWHLGDGSSLISASLLALALPPTSPWWVGVSCLLLALFFGKSLFGGNGRNLFNIAMLAYVLALMIFTFDIARWPNKEISAWTALHAIAGFTPIDGLAGATILESLKVNDRLTLDELYASFNSFGSFSARSSELINLSFLAGGVWLIRQKVIDWHTPIAVILGVFAVSLLLYNGAGSDGRGSPFFHLLSGATMLCAFFIDTEPVTAPKSLRARWLIGLGIGVGIYLFRSFSSFPDGVALMVLAANALTPVLEKHRCRR